MTQEPDGGKERWKMEKKNYKKREFETLEEVVEKEHMKENMIRKKKVSSSRGNRSGEHRRE